MGLCSSTFRQWRAEDAELDAWKSLSEAHSSAKLPFQSAAATSSGADGSAADGSARDGSCGAYSAARAAGASAAAGGGAGIMPLRSVVVSTQSFMRPSPFSPPPGMRPSAAVATPAASRDEAQLSSGSSGSWRRSIHARQAPPAPEAHLEALRLPSSAPPAPGGPFGLGGAYQPLALLGHGSTGQTWLCRQAATGLHCAVKLLRRPIPRKAVGLVYNEAAVQASACVSSVHATHIQEAVLTPSHLALVLEYVPGGSLAAFVARQTQRTSRSDLVVPEDYARFLFCQLVSVLRHLHSQRVAHRDVKLDNTLLDGQQPPTLLLCDFQFAKYWGAPHLARSKSHLGTAVYMAPELLRGAQQGQAAYDPVQVDVWASGVWLVALLCGAFPWDSRPGARGAAAEAQVLRQERSWPWFESRYLRPYVPLLTPECVDLLSRMLHPHPDLRLGIDAVAAHPWLHMPLPPDLAAALQRIEGRQRRMEQALGRLRLDLGLEHERSRRLLDLVHAAAAPPEQWHAASERLLQGCAGSRLVDAASIPGAVRLDLRPEAVAVQPSGSGSGSGSGGDSSSSSAGHEAAASSVQESLPAGPALSAEPGAGAPTGSSQQLTAPTPPFMPLHTISSIAANLSGLDPGSSGESALLAPPSPTPPPSAHRPPTPEYRGAFDAA